MSAESSKSKFLCLKWIVIVLNKRKREVIGDAAIHSCFFPFILRAKKKLNEISKAAMEDKEVKPGVLTTMVEGMKVFCVLVLLLVDSPWELELPEDEAELELSIVVIVLGGADVVVVLVVVVDVAVVVVVLVVLDGGAFSISKVASLWSSAVRPWSSVATTLMR